MRLTIVALLYNFSPHSLNSTRFRLNVVTDASDNHTNTEEVMLVGPKVGGFDCRLYAGLKTKRKGNLSVRKGTAPPRRGQTAGHNQELAQTP